MYYNNYEINMKKFAIYIYLISMMFFSGTAFAHNKSIYFGLDLIKGKNGYKNGFGEQLLSDYWTSGVNFFVGHYFSKWLGFEIGSQSFLSQSKVAEAQYPAMEFGVNEFSGMTDEIYLSKTSMKGLNLNLAPKFTLNKNISLVPFVGVAYVRTKIAVNILSTDGQPAAELDKIISDFNCAKSKFIPRIGVRAEYLLTKNCGCRISYIWENTSAIKLSVVRDNKVIKDTVTAKLKNTSTYSIGVFYNLIG